MSGPLPVYQPEFPDDFVAEARRLANARTAHAHLKQRARLALLLHDEPAVTNVAAGIRCDLHPNCVRRWRQRWASGNFSFEDAKGRGRKPTFSPAG